MLLPLMVPEPLQSAAIRIALEAGVLHIIEKEDGRVVSAAELSNKTGYDELLIGKMRRPSLQCPF
jgi:hypothetical protein